MRPAVELAYSAPVRRLRRAALICLVSGAGIVISSPLLWAVLFPTLRLNLLTFAGYGLMAVAVGCWIRSAIIERREILVRVRNEEIHTEETFCIR